MTTTPKTILFMPESAYGPTNQCIGIGKVLLERGHRVVFAAEASWKGKLTALGFEEDLVDLAPRPTPMSSKMPVSFGRISFVIPHQSFASPPLSSCQPSCCPPGRP